jgi:hypothetical protein
MSNIKDLFEKPASLSTGYKYTAMTGVLCLGNGALLVAWPRGTQTIFMDASFVGHEGALIRVTDLALAASGRLYLSGGRPGAPNRRRVCAQPIGVRSCVARARARGDAGCVPAFAVDVSGCRLITRDLHLGASRSKNVKPRISGTRFFLAQSVMSPLNQPSEARRRHRG